MLDASRVGRRRVEPAERRARAAFERTTARCRRQLREQHSARKERPLLPYEAALANRLRDRLGARDAARAGVHRPPRARDVPLDDLVPFIDWTFFFAAWELKGRFPAILDHPQYGDAGARALRQRARAARSHHRETAADRERRLRLLAGRERGRRHRRVSRRRAHTGELARFNMLRQQEAIADGKPNLSLADFVAPIGRAPARLPRRVRGHGRHRRRRSGAPVRARPRRLQRDPGEGARRSSRRSVRRYLHARRARDWGIDERATRRRRSSHETHRGIRPAFGYPGVPGSQREVQAVRAARGAATSGMALTEHAAMMPAASVSGLYFAHPAGAVLHRWPARRRPDRQLCAAQGQSVDEVERWLTPNLSYEPARC